MARARWTAAIAVGCAAFALSAFAIEQLLSLALPGETPALTCMADELGLSNLATIFASANQNAAQSEKAEKIAEYCVAKYKYTRRQLDLSSRYLGMKITYERKFIAVDQGIQARILQFYGEMPADLIADFARQDYLSAKRHETFLKSFALRHQLDDAAAGNVVGLIAVLANLRAIADDFQRP